MTKKNEFKAWLLKIFGWKEAEYYRFCYDKDTAYYVKEKDYHLLKKDSKTKIVKWNKCYSIYVKEK